MSDARNLLDTLHEMAVATWADQPKRDFAVVYDAVTPKGTRSRFTVRSAVSQIHNAMSETAVRSYLQRRHPQCDIQIVNLSFK
jgi:hypothetical protein